MLGKRYSLGSKDELTGEARIKLANFDELRSQDSPIADFLKTFTPDPKFTYIHVIAMGASEYYGCNINGDYFPERDLIARHKTFETNAKVFKEHDNKPYSPDYGHVAYAWYNPKMHRVELIMALDNIKGKEFIDRINKGEQLEVSMGCFPAGTLITMADGSQKPIEDVATNEEVLTHTGEAHKVVTKMFHDYTGDLYTFKVAGQTSCLKATANHPILVRRYTQLPTQGEGDCPVCGKHVKQVYTHILRKKDDTHKDYLDNILALKNSYREYWVRADEVQDGDYVVTPIAKNSQVKALKPQLARLLGYFLAEGSYVKYKGTKVAIQLNFHSEELAYHSEVLGLLEELQSNKPSYQIRPKKHLGVISLYNRDLAEEIANLCGEYSYGKFIHPDIFNCGEEFLLNLLGAYINGDGTWSKINDTLSITTVSRELATGIMALAAKCSIASTIVEVKLHLKRPVYQVVFSKSSTVKLASFTDKVPAGYNYTCKFVKLPAVFIQDGCICKRIQGHSFEPVVNLPVYNFSVDTDESYVAEMVAVHNCKVAYDVCSICGNKAKRRDDYCNHIRYEKKKIYPDGRQPYMINYNPTFFDISIVKRRADRIAYVLAKVASDESSALAEERCLAFENLVNDVIPEAPSEDQAVFDWEGSEFEKAAAETKEPPISYLDKLAMIKRIKADATRVMNVGMLKALPLLESVEQDLPPQLLDTMARRFTLADIIKSAMMNAVPLKPAEVTRIIIVQNRMPLSDFGSVLQGVMMARPTGLSQGNYQSEISSLLAPHLMNRSSYLPAIMHRLNVALGGLDKTSAAMNIDPFTSMNLLNPRLTFGYVQQQPAYNTFEPTVVPDRTYLCKSRLATTPVVRTAEDLEIELRRPKLKDPMLNPVQTGMVLGGMYASSKLMPEVAAFLTKNPELPIVAALASLFYAQHRKDDSMLQPQVMQKVSSDMGNTALKYGLPFVGAHLASAHYKNQYEHGHELNGVETFVAENPDILSIAAPIAVGLAMQKHASVDSTDYPVGNIDDVVAFADLMADFAYDRI